MPGVYRRVSLPGTGRVTLSLRDQLLKAGLVSKKDVDKANRDKKAERKRKQGHRKRKGQARAEAEAARQAALEAELLAKAEARKERDEAREVHERVHRIRQIILGNRMGAKGPLPFHVHSLDGRHLHRLQLPERVAFGLRCGELAVAALQDDDEARYYVIPRRAADKLADLAPEHLVFRVTDTHGISAPEEQFLQREWEPSLRPHKVPAG